MTNKSLSAGLALVADDDPNAAQRGTPHSQRPPSSAYSDWKQHMEAFAEDGTIALRDAWKLSHLAFQLYAIRHDREWFLNLKARARDAKPQEIP